MERSWLEEPSKANEYSLFVHSTASGEAMVRVKIRSLLTGKIEPKTATGKVQRFRLRKE
jgi:translation elongation factor P/translation initiation factor 5A